MSGLAKGYKRGSWKTVPDALNRYNDAFTRHQLEEGEGKLHDEESGLLTAAHTAWNALARLHFIILAERAHKKSRRATVLDLVQDKKGGSLG